MNLLTVRFVGFVGLALVIPATPVLSNELSAAHAPIVAGWEEYWDQNVDEMVIEIVVEFSNREPRKISDEKKAEYLLDMEEMFRRELSWELLGRAVTEDSLNRECGKSLLDNLAPYYSDPQSGSEIPTEILGAYEACVVDVQLLVDTAPAYAVMGIARDKLPLLYGKHGIDPNDW